MVDNRPDELTFDVTTEPDPRDIAALSEGLEVFNRLDALGQERTKVSIGVFIRHDDRVVGGAYGDIHYEWLYLSLLWLDEPWRRAGWGRQVVERFETVGREQGCRAAWVETYGFQAPGFYERMGYLEFGRLNDFPPGSARHFFWKSLL
jgi:GNAT superfamily N-acetyltransferase